MAGHSVDIDKKPGTFEVSQTLKTVYAVMIFVGVVILAIGLLREPERIWPSYLTSMFYFCSVVVGGLFFLAANYAAGAGWVVNIRRFIESIAAYTPYVAIASVLLYLGLDELYPWADPEAVASDPLLAVKVPYLNKPFFLIRTLLFAAGLYMFAKIFISRSLKQDQSGDPSLTTSKLVPWSIAYFFFFAIFFSMFSVDTLMALLPHWYSTIFAIYTFAGGFQAALAILILLILWAKGRGLLEGIVTIDHVHDIAKYLKGFTVFWAYIAFSQFLLIWYTNIPEETEFYFERMHGSWVWISLALIVFRFAVPFIALLPRWAKRSPAHLQAVCLLVLVMHYVDIYWIVYPNFNNHHVVFSFYEIGVFALFAGTFLLAVTRFLSQHPLRPLQDPRRHESFGHHVTY